MPAPPALTPDRGAAASRLELPVIGLLEDAVLPGEERTLSSPVVEAATLAALMSLAAREAAPMRTLCAVTIASVVELPSLVSARWATECALLAADATSITLRGERRVRVLSARGKQSPYTAEVEVAEDGASGTGAVELVAGAHAVFAALDAGAVPEPVDWAERLRAVLGGVLRALCTADELKESLRYPPDEAVRRLAQSLAARSQGEHASCALEAMAREIARKPELPKALKHRLWSQVVEIQKRLDVYDPTEAEEGDDVARLQRRLSQSGLPKIARETAKRELRLLRGMSTNHHDYSTYLAHLDFMARLPWHPDPSRPIDLDAVQSALDREHYGLPKAKQRVLEHLAVRALGGESAMAPRLLGDTVRYAFVVDPDGNHLEISQRASLVGSL